MVVALESDRARKAAHGALGSRVFTGVRFPHFGHAFAVGFSGFMRESITAMDGSRCPWTIASTESSISVSVMPSRKFFAALRRASSRTSSASVASVSDFLRVMPPTDRAVDAA